MLPWSVTATVSIPSSLTFGNRSFTRIAPSSRLYCVCRWRCVNPPMVRPYGLAHAADTPEAFSAEDARLRVLPDSRSRAATMPIPRSTPGPPIPAEPDIVVEYDGQRVQAGLDRRRSTPRQVSRTSRMTTASWARRRSAHTPRRASTPARRATPTADSQQAIAMACHRAAVSMQFATQRCSAGQAPRVD